MPPKSPPKGKGKSPKNKKKEHPKYNKNWPVWAHKVVRDLDRASDELEEAEANLEYAKNKHDKARRKYDESEGKMLQMGQWLKENGIYWRVLPPTPFF